MICPITGDISGDNIVCAFNNSGTIEVKNYGFSIVDWEYSEDNQNTWLSNSTNLSSLNFNDLEKTTFYRVIVSSEYGFCSNDTTEYPFEVTVLDSTFAGYVSKDTLVCEFLNDGNLQLVNNIGNVKRWEYSEDGLTWNPYESTLNTYPFKDLYQNQYVRAVVQNTNLCKTLITDPVLIEMFPKPVVNSISNDTLVCSKYNSGSIVIDDYTGNVDKWQFSKDNGITWYDTLVSNVASGILNFSGLTDTTTFRPFLSNQVCTDVTEVEVNVFTDDTTVSGYLDGFNEYCAIALSGQFELKDYLELF